MIGVVACSGMLCLLLHFGFLFFFSLLFLHSLNPVLIARRKPGISFAKIAQKVNVMNRVKSRFMSSIPRNMAQSLPSEYESTATGRKYLSVLHPDNSSFLEGQGLYERQQLNNEMSEEEDSENKENQAAAGGMDGDGSRKRNATNLLGAWGQVKVKRDTLKKMRDQKAVEREASESRSGPGSDGTPPVSPRTLPRASPLPYPIIMTGDPDSENCCYPCQSSTSSLSPSIRRPSSSENLLHLSADQNVPDPNFLHPDWARSRSRSGSDLDELVAGHLGDKARRPRSPIGGLCGVESFPARFLHQDSVLDKDEQATRFRDFLRKSSSENMDETGLKSHKLESNSLGGSRGSVEREVIFTLDTEYCPTSPDDRHRRSPSPRKFSKSSGEGTPRDNYNDKTGNSTPTAMDQVMAGDVSDHAKSNQVISPSDSIIIDPTVSKLDDLLNNNEVLDLTRYSEQQKLKGVDDFEIAPEHDKLENEVTLEQMSPNMVPSPHLINMHLLQQTTAEQDSASGSQAICDNCGDVDNLDPRRGQETQPSSRFSPTPVIQVGNAADVNNTEHLDPRRWGPKRECQAEEGDHHETQAKALPWKSTVHSHLQKGVQQSFEMEEVSIILNRFLR